MHACELNKQSRSVSTLLWSCLREPDSRLPMQESRLSEIVKPEGYKFSICKFSNKASTKIRLLFRTLHAVLAPEVHG